MKLVKTNKVISSITTSTHSFTNSYISDKPVLHEIVTAYLYAGNENQVMQFILDCSVLPLVITAYQKYGPVIQAIQSYPDLVQSSSPG